MVCLHRSEHLHGGIALYTSPSRNLQEPDFPLKVRNIKNVQNYGWPTLFTGAPQLAALGIAFEEVSAEIS